MDFSFEKKALKKHDLFILMDLIISYIYFKRSGKRDLVHPSNTFLETYLYVFAAKKVSFVILVVLCSS